ncbi:alpha/beta hydrolase [Aquincola sp. MAHUQ-54]|uniref:Alpha/beta hydrolase n=1 Tax=Aquincola agrisoli TaxID=3119538 RepID=A0AAW9Q829_9BURK
MTSFDTWPFPVATAADVATLEAAADVVHTPCGDGRMTWHTWGDGPAVVLLHGGAGSWTHWVRTIGPLVAAGRRVLAADMPGFGDSAEPPDGHDADVLPRWIAEGLARLAPREPFDLVGFSFGGLVSGLLAAGGTCPVRRLVLVGAPALSAETMPPLPLRVWERLPPGERRDAVHRHNLGVLMLSRPDAIDDLAVSLHAANIVRDRMRRRRLMRTDLLLRTLPHIGCTVQGIWGEEDALYRGRLDVVRHALAQAPRAGAPVFIEGAGHWVQYERPEAFNQALARALDAPA